MERELALSRRREHSVGVLMIDIDHFKAINDAYGHQVGDAVIQRVGQHLIHSTRSYDWPGRYGGEEFLVVLANCDAETLAICAERIRETIASEPVRVADMELTVTVSIGTALSSPNNSLVTGNDLVAVADSALYRAKSQGRNCVEVGLANYLLHSSV
jgi:two-component system cell cycle response regulator